MEHSLFNEVTKKNILIWVQARAFRKWFWQDLFPLKSHPFLSYEALIGTEGAPVAADVVSYDVSAPEKKRQIITSVKGDIPSIRAKRSMKESDINMYNTIKASQTPDMTEMVNLVFNDIEFAINAVRARMEWLSLQLISSGFITLSKSTNAGVVTETNVDYGMSSSYKSGAAVIWSAAVANTTPITDIETITQAALLRGIVLKYIYMDRQSWLYLRASTETTNFIMPYTISGILAKQINAGVRVEDVNRALRDSGLPIIVIVDQSITVETEAHVQTAANPFHAGHICFTPEMGVGNMLHGPIAEETNPPKQIIQAKVENILVSKWSEADPVLEWTKGESNVFPVWLKIDQCYLLDTLHASTWTDPS